MIGHDDLVQIGSFFKTHGIKGELSAGFDYDIDPADLSCIIVEIDGIPTPFFIESVRGQNKIIVKLQDVDNADDAAELTKHDFYITKKEFERLSPADDDADGFYLADLIGYSLHDTDGDAIGKIVDFDDSTANILLHIETAAGKTAYVPFADELIDSIDTENKTITMNLPEGIIGLN